MAARTPRDAADARRLLERADLDTDEGREQAERVIQWAEGRRNLPADVERAVTSARIELQDKELMRRLGTPVRQLQWIWRQNERAGRAIIEGIRRLSTGEVDTEKVVDLAWPHLTPDERRELERRGQAPESVDIDRPELRRPGGFRAGQAETFRALEAEAEVPEGTTVGALSPEQQDMVDAMVAEGWDPDEAAAFVRDMLGDEEPDLPVGVPEDHRVPQSPEALALAGTKGVELLDRKPLYRQSDIQEPFGWPGHRIAQLQDELVKAGLLTGQFVRGFYDEATGEAYAKALGLANQRAGPVDSTLDRLAEERERQLEEEFERRMAEFEPEPWLAPDPAALERAARDGVLGFLGREPDDDELDLLASRLESFERKAHAQRVEFERRLHERQVGQEFALARGEEPSDDPFDASGLQMVDPGARLDQEIRTMFGPERRHLEAADQYHDEFQGVTANIMALDQAILGR